MDFLDIAILEAEKALKEGEVPVGAVIVKNGKVISKAYNMKEKLKNPLAHSEIMAINEACKKQGDWRLNGYEMYVTLEPCSMCASAIIQSRISKLYIGTFNKDMGACGTILDITNNRYLNSNLEIEWMYSLRCGDLMKKFFENRRKSK